MSASIDRFDRIRRLFGEVAFAHLTNKTVAIIGLGSGGGKVALSLAMLGVGNFILIDDDVLDEANLVRHVCDARDIGRSKVEAVRDLIHYRNDEARVITIPDTVEHALEILQRADVVAVCVDDEPAKHVINVKLLELGIPAIYAGVYERGEGGDVVVVYPDHGPCYSCVASQLAVEEPTNDDKPRDYGMIESGVLKGEPGLGIDVERVALMQAKFVLRVLLADVETSLKPLPGNLVILANEPGVVIGEDENGPVMMEMGGAFWHDLPQVVECNVCNLALGSAEGETSLADIFATN
jgi:molybdopterin/thiamine biosynthesis adenylyltransferase